MSTARQPSLPGATPETVDALRAQLAMAEAAFRARTAEAERAQGALRAIADGVATVDLKGRIASFNPGRRTWSGWSEVEALGRQLTRSSTCAMTGGRRWTCWSQDPRKAMTSHR